MPPSKSDKPIILDSVTQLGDEHRGRASYCASHGGLYAGYMQQNAEPARLSSTMPASAATRPASQALNC